MPTVYRSHRAVGDNFIHVVVLRHPKGKWDMLCKGWLAGRVKSDDVHDEVPTRLFCIGRIGTSTTSSTSRASGHHSTTSGTRSA